jgi:hypothetical protein
VPFGLGGRVYPICGFLILLSHVEFAKINNFTKKVSYTGAYQIKLDLKKDSEQNSLSNIE